MKYIEFVIIKLIYLVKMWKKWIKKVIKKNLKENYSEESSIDKEKYFTNVKFVFL